MAVSLSSYRTPGVYVQEIAKLPPSIAQVETAIPSFFGKTQIIKRGKTDLTGVPTRITSMIEYEAIFGTTEPIPIDIEVDTNPNSGLNRIEVIPKWEGLQFMMYYSLQSYFANGGGPCYIISTGAQKVEETPERGTPPPAPPKEIDLIVKLETEDEPTLLVFPDAVYGEGYGDLLQAALLHCADPKQNNRFVIMDVPEETDKNEPDRIGKDAENFRELVGTGIEKLKYGAAYYPYLKTTLPIVYHPEQVIINSIKQGGKEIDEVVTALTGLQDDTASQAEKDKIEKRKEELTKMKELSGKNINEACEDSNALYNEIIRALREKGRVTLPPSSIIAGIYAQTDNLRGVWKSPANVSVNTVIGPDIKISDNDNDRLNVDTNTGKSINAIRAFTGQGNLVWGGRTLAGNDNEWRYISIRRFFNMVEESTKRSLRRFVFEPNNRNTWVKVKAMIDNYLNGLWRAGALLGDKPEQAYKVAVGMPETFTEDEMFQGFMVVEIHMAVVRPAEFIVLKFMHKFQDE